MPCQLLKPSQHATGGFLDAPQGDKKMTRVVSTSDAVPGRDGGYKNSGAGAASKAQRFAMSMGVRS